MVMKTVFLVGYMCCGKTTLGSAIAAELGVPFVDLDEWVERRAGCSVREIFATQGETAFRRMERAALREVASGDGRGAIVACGGGTPCQRGNMALMNKIGITVWLTTSAERLAARLCLPEHKTKRPLIAALPDEAILAHVVEGLAQREPYYAQAQLRFDSTLIETARETEDTTRRLAAILRTKIVAP